MYQQSMIGNQMHQLVVNNHQQYNMSMMMHQVIPDMIQMGMNSIQSIV
jgi:hypothetical protein